jgi:hypothetical protein
VLAIVGSLFILALGVGTVVFWLNRPDQRAAGALVQEAYVWQRSWTPAVQEAVGSADPALAGLVVLAAETGWEQGRPRTIEVAADYAALKARGLPVGLAVRVGTYAGPFDAQAPATRLVVELAARQLARARTAGLAPSELQIDFDCAESHLDGYRQWIVAIKQQVGAVPVIFTALSSWLNSRHFGPLAQAADGFILQVHSLERPASADVAMTLCDPAAARAAVETAARFGRPFRVALPTYGYLLAFDAGGRFVGLSAEGPAPNWPADVLVRPLRSDPVEMAALVRQWQADRPAAMRGIIWYRLPTRGDILNWRPATFSTVLSGQTPRRELRAQTRRAPGGAIEVELASVGQASAPLKATVVVRWRGARCVAADAIGGYQRLESGAEELRLGPTPEVTLIELGPGERRTIGWLRLSDPVEVEVDVVPESP